MKKLFALIVGLTAIFSLSPVGVAGAAPTATSNITIEPQGTTYKEAYVPTNLGLRVDTMPEPGATTLKPLVTVQFNLTKDQKFAPDPKMPVCTSITEADANYPPSEALRRCPNSVVGDGTASLYLAQQVAALVTDPVLTVFNAGTDNQGRGKLTIHAYSASTNVGIYLEGTLKEGILEVFVPRLTADSSVPSLDVNIPGNIGQTKDYVQTRCTIGSWTTNAELLLANRSASGQQTDDEIVTTTPQTTQCAANAGKAKFGSIKVKPKGKTYASKRSRSNVAEVSAAKPKVSKFKVTVKNKGTATAKNMKLSPKGAAKGITRNVSKIAPGKTKSYTVKAFVKGRKGQKVTVKIKVDASKTKAKVGKTKVRLK